MGFTWIHYSIKYDSTTEMIFLSFTILVGTFTFLGMTKSLVTRIISTKNTHSSMVLYGRMTKLTTKYSQFETPPLMMSINKPSTMIYKFKTSQNLWLTVTIPISWVVYLHLQPQPIVWCFKPSFLFSLQSKSLSHDTVNACETTRWKRC